MRRALLGLFTAVVLATAFAAPALASKPARSNSIDAVTVTSTGGTWPTCSQTVTVDFTADSAGGMIVVGPMPGPGFQGEYTAQLFTARMPRLQSTVTVRVVQDFSVLAEQGYGAIWTWDAAMTDRRGRYIATPLWTLTSSYDFAGSCPAAGAVLATY